VESGWKYSLRLVAESLKLKARDMQPSKVLVAIPAYNEEKRIESVVRSCLATGSEVWVIDDGSMDLTAESAQKAGGVVIRHEKNMGKGKAIRTALDAFMRSEHEFLIFMDADGQHDPSFIPVFVQCARHSSAGIMVGNRMHSTVNMPLVRRWTNQFMSWLISCLAGRRIPDTQCGYRLVSRAFVERFRPTTNRFELESEMLIQAGKLGFAVESVPISTVYAGEASHIHPFVDTLRFICMVIRYLFRSSHAA